MTAHLPPYPTNEERHAYMTQLVRASARGQDLLIAQRNLARQIERADRYLARLHDLERQVACLLALLAQAYPGDISVDADLTPESAADGRLRWQVPPRQERPETPPRAKPEPKRDTHVHFGGKPVYVSPEMQARMEKLIATPLPDPAAYDRTIGGNEV